MFYEWDIKFQRDYNLESMFISMFFTIVMDTWQKTPKLEVWLEDMTETRLSYISNITLLYTSMSQWLEWYLDRMSRHIDVTQIHMARGTSGNNYADVILNSHSLSDTW